MAYTTESDVRAIIDVDTGVLSLTPFIEAASLLVAAHCTGIDNVSAKIVETWLAAHLITIRDNRASTESVGSVSMSAQYKLDLGLSCSMYGQTAMQLDPTGGLARWNTSILKGVSRATASVTWLGKEPSSD